MRSITLKLIYSALTLALLASCGQQTNDGAAGQSAAPVAGSFNSIDLTGAPYAQGFSLPDYDGKLRDLKEFKGKVVVVFFGFTHCPDVCPTTMAEIKEVKRLLGAQGDKLQGIFITLDPERDTAAMLKPYVQTFDPSFLGLIGTPEQTAQLAKDFRIYYKKVAGSSAQDYSLDHTAASFVYDTQGRLRLYTRYNSGAEKLAADIQKLLAE